MFLRLRTHRIDQLFISLTRMDFRKPISRYLQKKVELITHG
nr:MAG TPA: putative small integral membrane protein [Caudoviricetes sp.]